MGRKCRREYIWISNYKTCYKCSCVYWIDRLSQKRNTRNPKFQCFKVWTLPINAPKCLKFWQSILRARRQKLVCKNITNMSNALFLMINCQYPEIYVFYILPLIFYHAKYYFFCKTLDMYVPQWQKLYASILKPSVKNMLLIWCILLQSWKLY